VLAKTVRHIAPLDVAPLSPGRTDKWIEIKLSEHRLTCYEDTTPVFSTPLASGVGSTPTPRGEFKVLYKRHTQRMIGDDYDLTGVAFRRISPRPASPSTARTAQTISAVRTATAAHERPQPGCPVVFRWTDPVVPYSEHTLVTGAAAGTRVVVSYYRVNLRLHFAVITIYWY
jgi:hypothetical protein